MSRSMGCYSRSSSGRLTAGHYLNIRVGIRKKMLVVDQEIPCKILFSIIVHFKI